jgi:hypothetical protein
MLQYPGHYQKFHKDWGLQLQHFVTTVVILLLKDCSL